MTNQQLAIELTQIGSTTIINVMGLWILAWYRVKRQWKRAKNETWMQRFEAYWVEIVITVVVVPQWPDAIRAAFKLIPGG